MTKRLVKRLAALLFLLIIAGIALGHGQGTALAEDSDLPWWYRMNDPVLVSLIDQGFLENPSLLTIQSRAKQAQALSWVNLAPVLPQVSIELSGREAAIESLGSNTIEQMERIGQDVPDSYRNGSAMLVGKLDLDLFGRNTLNFIGSRHDAKASAADSDKQATSLSRMIAHAYLEVLAGRERLSAVLEQIKANEELLTLIQLRYERGNASGLEVLQQRQQLASTSTLLPAAQAALALAGQQLAVLLGKSPSETIEIPEKTVPSIQVQAPGVDQPDLMISRPDLRAADARKDAQSARRNNAIVTFLPTVGLYGQAGEQATYIVDQEQEFVWEVGATISIPLFAGGRNVANYQQAQAAKNAARHDLRRAQLEAQQELDTLQTQKEQYTRQVQAYTLQLKAATDALGQSKSRYLSGLVDYQTVLLALNARQQAQLSLIDARLNQLKVQISNWDARGGQWTHDLCSSRKESAQ